MKRRIKAMLCIALVIVMSVSGTVYAKSGNNGKGNGNNGNGGNKEKNIEKFENKESNGNAHGWRRRVHEDYVKINRNRLRVNGSEVDFLDDDTAPVIINGRTMLPLRAITDALGGYVYWDEDSSTAAVINEDMTIMIWFDLDEMEDEDECGITIFDVEEDTDFDEDYNPFEEDYNVEVDWDVRGWDCDVDVLPGLIDDRSFVPLRFIAEVFELSVYYDDDSGRIDIKAEPKLFPHKLDYEEDSEEEIQVGIILNGYTLKGIYESYDEEDEDFDDRLEEDEDYTTEAAIVFRHDFDDGMMVTLDGDYLDTIDDQDEGTVVKLFFRFIKEDMDDLVKVFKIVIAE